MRVARIFVEFFRLPDAQIGYLCGGWLTMGMVLSLPMLAIGIWAMVHAMRKREQGCNRVPEIARSGRKSRV